MARPRIEPAPTDEPTPPAARPGPSGGRWSERVQGEPALALEAVERAAEDWGAGWEPDEGGVGAGRLELPVSAGLRHGRLTARVEVSGHRAGSEVTLVEERSEYHLWTPAVVILVIAAGGALLTVLWPFFPELLPAAPVGAILGLSAWFLIVTRLQNRGAEEFLALVVGHAGEMLAGDDPPDEARESVE